MILMEEKTKLNLKGSDTSCSGSENEATEDDEVDYYELIERNRLDLVKTIDLGRHYLFSYLRSNLVLDNEDCERILNSGKTTQQTAAFFLDVIQQKGENGMKHFINALQVEHPGIFRKMTGKEPALKGSDMPYMLNTSDMEVRVLAERYERAMSELYTLTKFCKNLEEEKSAFEKKANETESVMRMLHHQIEEYKQSFGELLECRRTSGSDDGNDNSDYQMQCQMQQKIMQSCLHTNVLYHKLLESKEENDRLRNELEQEKKKRESQEQECNQRISLQIAKLALRCDKEKRNSKILNEKILNQNEHFRTEQKDIRELKLENSILKEENEELNGHLSEFKKYSGLLNVKYNAISLERSQLKEYHEEISFSFEDAKEKILELHDKCTALQWENGHMKRLNLRLQTDITMYRGYYNNCREELEKIRSDRLNAWNARKAALKELEDAKRSFDESLHNQLIITSALELKYNDVCEQLECMRDCFDQTKEELIETQKKMGTLQNNRRKQSLLNLNDNVCGPLEKEKAKDINEKEKHKSSEDLEEETQNEGEQESVENGSRQNDIEKAGLKFGRDCPFNERRAKELLDSLRRKALQDEPVTPTKATKSLSRLTFKEMALVGYPNEIDELFTPNTTRSLPNPNKNGINKYSRSVSDVIKESRNMLSEEMKKKGPARSFPSTFSESFLPFESTDNLLRSSVGSVCSSENAGQEEGTETAENKRLSFKNNRQEEDIVQEIKVERQFVQNTIKKSHAFDFPPLKIHSLHSPPGKQRSDTLYTYFSTDKSSKDEVCFRQRLTGHVDINDKSKWSERKRSLSCPHSPYAINTKFQM